MKTKFLVELNGCLAVREINVSIIELLIKGLYPFLKSKNIYTINVPINKPYKFETNDIEYSLLFNTIKAINIAHSYISPEFMDITIGYSHDTQSPVSYNINGEITKTIIDNENDLKSRILEMWDKLKLTSSPSSFDNLLDVIATIDLEQFALDVSGNFRKKISIFKQIFKDEDLSGVSNQKVYAEKLSEFFHYEKLKKINDFLPLNSKIAIINHLTNGRRHGIIFRDQLNDNFNKVQVGNETVLIPKGLIWPKTMNIPFVAKIATKLEVSPNSFCKNECIVEARISKEEEDKYKLLISQNTHAVSSSIGIDPFADSNSIVPEPFFVKYLKYATFNPQITTNLVSFYIPEDLDNFIKIDLVSPIVGLSKKQFNIEVYVPPIILSSQLRGIWLGIPSLASSFTAYIPSRPSVNNKELLEDIGLIPNLIKPQEITGFITAKLQDMYNLVEPMIHKFFSSIESGPLCQLSDASKQSTYNSTPSRGDAGIEIKYNLLDNNNLLTIDKYKKDVLLNPYLSISIYDLVVPVLEKLITDKKIMPRGDKVPPQIKNIPVLLTLIYLHVRKTGGNFISWKSKDPLINCDVSLFIENMLRNQTYLNLQSMVISYFPKNAAG